MTTIINSRVPEFKVQAFHNGQFITVSNEDIKGKWAIFFFLSCRFYLCLPDRAGRYGREIRTV